MILSKTNLQYIRPGKIEIPNEEILKLPERVLQFGTGSLLRGLPDYFIDQANKQGLFNGRIVMVKSTDSGDVAAFTRQDGLYTLCVRGMEGGQLIEENIINASVSRVLQATTQWKDILQCAHNPDINLIISNTTEVGIQLTDDHIGDQPPSSFPGKLIAFLFERYKAFNGSIESGTVVVPTELITNNGRQLKAIILELCSRNELGDHFQKWLETCNQFCDSLVDRIVPGRPGEAEKLIIENELGYTDELMIIAESYRLWAIEGDKKVVDKLSFAAVDKAVIVAPDITIFRELKLRLLNGVHTICCAAAYLSGFDTVVQAMNDKFMYQFIEDIMLREIARAVPYQVPGNEALDFGRKVLDRFRNPHLHHQWLSISLQYSSKMKLRDIPILLKYYDLYHGAPPLFAKGFAAYLLFMRVEKEENGKYFGLRNGKYYALHDDKAAWFSKIWRQSAPSGLVDQVLRETELWGHDLSVLRGFSKLVKQELELMIEKGVAESISTSTSEPLKK
jgi:tagaturonate reductase